MSEAFADERGRAPQSANLAACLQRAAIYAEEQGHRLITLEHVLLALTEDPEAIAVLRVSGLDLDDLRNDTASLVGQIDDRVPLDSQVPPQTSPDLIRVLDAASAAANAKRRTIDGAIVLAALIGEGHSAAAELLKVRGLTFDAAIRTMRMKPLSAASPMPPSGRVARPDAVPRSQRRAALEHPPAPLANMPWHRNEPPLDRRPPVSETVPRSRAVPPLPPLPPFAPRPSERTDYASERSDQRRPGGRTTVPRPEPAYDLQPDDNYEPYPPERAPAPSRTSRQRPEPRPNPQSAPSRRPKESRRGSKSRRGDNDGPLLISAASRIKLGEAEAVEARVPLRALTLLDGSGEHKVSHRDMPFVTRALTVRLRALNDDAVIEPGAPETQWIEQAIGLQDDDFGSWRWTIVPQNAGRLQLRFSLSSRTVGADGLTAETTLPEQIVELRVSGTPLRVLLRWFAWFSLTAGALMAGAIGEHVFNIVGRILGR